jgi:glycosyltransferase involved in cell wall biosynthesis
VAQDSPCIPSCLSQEQRKSHANIYPMSVIALRTTEEQAANLTETAAIGIVMPLGSQQGGAEALLQHLLRHREHAHRYVCAFLEEGPLVTEVRELGYDTTVFATTHLSHASNYLKTLRSLRAWIKAKRLRTVVSWMAKAHMYVSPASMFLPASVVWFQHGVPHRHPMDRLISLFPAKAVLCCSDTSKRGQDQMFPVRQSHVCYPGIVVSPEAGRSKTQARDRLGLPQNAAIVGMVARLEHWKGAHVFVEAAENILENHPDVTLFVVGGDHPLDVAYAEKVKGMVRELHCGERFILAGQRPMTEVPLWHAAADLIVHPVVGVEPFGMSVVEAMAAGKVVVASDLGGPAEVIQHGVNGILIRGGDATLLASTVLQLLKDPDRRDAIEKQARLRAQNFSVDAFAVRFNQLMTQLLPR